MVARGGWEGGPGGIPLELNRGKGKWSAGHQAKEAKLFAVKEMDAPPYWTTEVAGLVQRRGPMPSELSYCGVVRLIALNLFCVCIVSTYHRRKVAI